MDVIFSCFVVPEIIYNAKIQKKIDVYKM